MSVATLAAALKTEVQKQNYDQILEILETLQETEITLPDLRATKVGKTVGKLRKSPNTTVSSVAKSLISKWAQIAKFHQKAKISSHSKASAAIPKGTPTKVDTKMAMAQVSALTGNPTRDAVRKGLVKALRPENEAAHPNYKHIAYSIEDALYAVHATSKEYTQRYRDLAWNLRDSKNPGLNEALLSGEILPQRFIHMSSDELASDKVKVEREASREWMKQANRSDHNTGASMTDEFKCGKCKTRNCSYYQQQTRGADEPMTTFVTCMTCGNRWKC